MTSLLQNPLRRMLPLVKRFIASNQPDSAPDNQLQAAETIPFYQLTSRLATGHDFPFADLRGRQILLVNTPLDGSNSPQYQELQQLAAQFANELVVLAFPTADFAGPASAASPSLPAGDVPGIQVMQPVGVLKNTRQHPVYRWLSTARQNGWNEQAPPQPFTKYLVSATGQLAHYFGPTLSPLSETVIDCIKEASA